MVVNRTISVIESSSSMIDDHPSMTNHVDDVNEKIKSSIDEIGSEVMANGEAKLEELDDDKPTICSANYKYQIVWRNVFTLSLLHLFAFYSFTTFAMNPSIQWYHFLWPDLFGRLSGLGILAGSHRLWSHKSYKARLPLRIVLMIFQTMALQNDIYDWSRDHRLHHKHSDTDADPYNARRGFFFSHMGWLMVRKHPEVIRKGRTLDLSDIWSDPVVRFQRRFYIPLVILFWGLMPTYLTHYITEIPLFECFCGVVVFRYTFALHSTWLVNSAAHLYGYQFYDQKLEPRENRFVSYFTWGEGYHNYHHAFPWDYSASELGWTKCYNLATAFIDLCAFLGLAYDLKKAHPKLIRKRIERTGDPMEWMTVKTTLAKGIADYVLGFLISNHILLVTWIVRYHTIGHF